jgi:hypothetical protein
MTSTPETTFAEIPNERGTLSLWAGVLGAPAVWALQLNVGYALVPYVCRHYERHYLLHLASVVFILLALACGWICYREWDKVGRKWPSDTVGGAIGRVQFLATLGVLSSALFSLVIVAQALASFFIDPCWT